MECVQYMLVFLSQCILIKNGICSNVISVTNVVKQEGILSPIPFCIYMDVLLITLKECRVGCHLGDKCVGAVGYADDCLFASIIT